ncbi:hypothetical protein HK414_24405 [Ramlibacter terrae]|uniref:Uncharacterized protein n=1 Tax=Ramlibacter terrae TaxID=2732511 RepID=A0ABX6P5I3_9BURK|nr:hypothetical protein HK414_24405 [Ramlibacter terrae]
MLTARPCRRSPPSSSSSVEDTRTMGIDLIDAIAPVAAATLILQWIGPLATQLALVLAGEVQEAPPAAGAAR